MTKFEMFAKIASALSNDAEVVDFCKHEQDLLLNRKSSERKPTAHQRENEVLKVGMLEFLKTTGRLFTLTEVLSECKALPTGMTLNRLSALMTQLKNDGSVIRTEVKGKAYFSANFDE